MKSNEILGGIVAGCLMVIAFSVFANTNIKTVTVPLPLPEKNVTLTFVEGMPVREAVKIDSRQLDCMARNIYFEARNQDTDDAFADVGYTVLNRVASKRYPNSICAVVYQGRKRGGEYVRNMCQFSWVCDGKSDNPNLKHPVEAKAWARAQRIARGVMLGTIDNPVGNATMYHATYVNPYWKSAYMRVAKVETHIFYQSRPKRTNRA
jgi:spore germination cell wall hydrolase CwlJ-like protein